MLVSLVSFHVLIFIWIWILINLVSKRSHWISIIYNLYIIYLVNTDTVPVRTVNRQCSSGLQAVADVAAHIKAGFYEIGR